MYSHINSSASQNPIEIAKLIRQSFLTAEKPAYQGDRIAKRTNTNASAIRDADDWRATYHRRARHESEGFFSALGQPYEELGETELSTKSLVVNAMKDIGAIFEAERKLWIQPQKLRAEVMQEKNELPKIVAKMQKVAEKQKSHELRDSGFEAVREILNDGEMKITYLKAGKPLIDCLSDASKPTAEWRQSIGNQKRGKLIMETPDHLIKKDNPLESCARNKREPDSKARKRFLAKLKCLRTIFCCVLNMKNRDLRSKSPLVREALQFLKREVSADWVQPQPNRLPRLSAVPTAFLPNHRSLKLQNTSSSDTGSLCPRSLALGRAPSIVPSTDDCESSISRYRLTTAEAGIKTKNGLKISSSRIAALNPGIRSETLDCALSPHVDQAKVNDSLAADQLSLGKGGKFSSFLANFRTTLKPRRGAIFQNKGNFDLPLWQRVIQEEARREEIKHSRKAKELKNKQPEDVENILKQTKKAFLNMKSRCAKKLQKDLDTRVGYLRQRFNCLEVSIFHEEDLRNMRLKVKELQRRESLDNTCPTGWYEQLCNEQSSLNLDNDDEVLSEVKGLLQFTRLELTAITHLRAKLCLLVMSLPVYELCRLSMQQAFKFFLTSIMEISEHVLEDWMLSRKLIASNVLMD